MPKINHVYVLSASAILLVILVVVLVLHFHKSTQPSQPSADPNVKKARLHLKDIIDASENIKKTQTDIASKINLIHDITQKSDSIAKNVDNVLKNPSSTPAQKQDIVSVAKKATSIAETTITDANKSIQTSNKVGMDTKISLNATEDAAKNTANIAKVLVSSAKDLNTASGATAQAASATLKTITGQQDTDAVSKSVQIVTSASKDESGNVIVSPKSSSTSALVTSAESAAQTARLAWQKTPKIYNRKLQGCFENNFGPPWINNILGQGVGDWTRSPLPYWLNIGEDNATIQSCGSLANASGLPAFGLNHGNCFAGSIPTATPVADAAHCSPGGSGWDVLAVYY